MPGTIEYGQSDRDVPPVAEELYWGEEDEEGALDDLDEYVARRLTEYAARAWENETWGGED